MEHRGHPVVILSTPNLFILFYFISNKSVNDPSSFRAKCPICLVGIFYRLRPHPSVDFALNRYNYGKDKGTLWTTMTNSI